MAMMHRSDDYKHLDMVRMRSAGIPLDVIAKKWGMARVSVHTATEKVRKDDAAHDPDNHDPAQFWPIRRRT